MNLISIKNNIGIPKYKQIVLSIEKAIEGALLRKDEKLPSINKVCLAHSLSRDTVLQAYDELKKRGVIYAILGKGYFVKSTEIKPKERLFLLFDELNIFKEDLYNSFLNAMGTEAEVDIYFHHFNVSLFRKLIQESKGNYTKYILMPTNLSGITPIIKTLPVQEVFILDQTNAELKNYPAIYQNFVKDMYEGLLKGKSQLAKYTKLILLFPGFREPIGMKIGFEKFCNEFRFNYEIIAEFTHEKIELGSVYIIPSDRDLVQVIEQAKRQQLELGNDYGIISYNETPLKKLVEKGITTISTDFEAMGKTLAEMILKNKKIQIENPSQLLLRNSL
jgi:DNA-binding transcriptional regulator YhcF (GntR family)